MKKLSLKDYKNNQHEFCSWKELFLFHLFSTRYIYIIVFISWVIIFLLELLSIIVIKDRFPGELSLTIILPVYITIFFPHYLLFKKQLYRIVFTEDTIVLFRMLKKEPLKIQLEELQTIKIGWFFYIYKFKDGRSFWFVDNEIENLRFLEKHGFPLTTS